MRCALSGLLFLLCILKAHGEELSLSLTSGNEITVEQFGTAENRLIWLPSESGLNGEPERQHARKLAAAGYSVWVVDLHNSYFITPGQSSLKAIPRGDLVELISLAQKNTRYLYLFSYDRGARLLLEALRDWQLLRKAESPTISGVLLMHPNLLAGDINVGDEPRFHAISAATNLPIYVFQPVDSGKRWYITTLVSNLEQGGSDVITHRIFGVSDGYHVSDMARDYELKRREGFAQLLIKAMHLVKNYANGPRQAVKQLASGEEKDNHTSSLGLREINGESIAPNLRLNMMSGEHIDLAKLRGEVVLVNFWATWCPPCIEEIPSLDHLNEQLAGKPFRVLGIDVGESKAQVQKFLKKVPAAYPIILDPNGVTTAPWKIRAFPTSYIVDKDGRLRYGYFGGLAWDDEEVVTLIENLIAEE